MAADREPGLLPLALGLIVILGVLPVAAAGGIGLEDPAGVDGGFDGASPPDLGLDNLCCFGLSPFEMGAITLGVAAAAALAFALAGTKFVTAENVLENTQRRTIFEFLRTNPGSHLRETATKLDLSTTNVLWHLRKLEGANLVNSKKVEGYKVYYPTEGGIEGRRLSIALSVLKNPNAREILDHITQHPGTHQREIARALGVNHGTVRWHLRKLNNVGIVLPVVHEHVTQYFVSELGTRALLSLQARELAARGAQVAPAPQPIEAAAPTASVMPATAGAPAMGPGEDEE